MDNSRHLVRVGTFLCVLSTIGYTAYNLCLRDVSEQCDPAWVNCVQASVSVVVLGVWLAWLAIRKRPVLPPWKELLALVALGVVTQLGGVLLVWAMSIVGVAVTVTLQTGGMLAISAVLGLIVLNEKVSRQQVIAICLITLSVVLLSVGAEPAGETTVARGPLMILLGVTAGVLAGLAFAVLTVGVRKVVTGNTSAAVVVFVISLMGVVALGPWCVYQQGVAALAQTEPRDFGVMLAAGALNLVAFFLVTKSLQLISVVRVNVLNNGLTTGLTAAAGIMLLSEPWNRTLLLGIALCIAGIGVISFAEPTATLEETPVEAP